MKTIKQIADELGLPKQKVYRYIKKNHIKESHQKNGMMYYDDVNINNIKSAFEKKTTSNEALHEVHQNHINHTINEAVVDLLKNELENKNKQIIELQSELKKEREHNREKDKQLLDTLTKLAESQAELSAGQTADKQKALVEKMVEVKEKKEEPISVTINSDPKEEKNNHLFNRLFKRVKNVTK